jgi:hypothetical protein
MAAKGQHVVPNTRGGWSVRQTGAQRASRVFDSEAEAVLFARARARESRSNLYVHRRDGTIRERGTYAADRNPPKG